MPEKAGYPITRSAIARYCLTTILLVNVGVCHASGFSVPGGLSIAGLGTADTLVANPDEVGALPDNPAAMSFHQIRSLALGLTAVWPNDTLNKSAFDEKR